MNSKMKTRDIQIIMVIFGIVIVFLSYKFVFTKLNANTAQLKTENASLSAKITELEEKQAHRTELEAQKIADEKKAEEILNTYPEEFTVEKAIDYAINIMEKCLVGVSSITIGSSQSVYAFQDSAGTAVEGLPVVSATTVNVNYTGSYSALKDAMTQINHGSTRIRVDDISSSYNSETGVLSGTATLSVFTVTGDVGREYVEPEFDLDTGRDNIFGTIGESAVIE